MPRQLADKYAIYDNFNRRPNSHDSGQIQLQLSDTPDVLKPLGDPVRIITPCSSIVIFSSQS